MDTWNPDSYLAYERERTQPSRDLAGRIEIDPRRVIDIGCGPGNSTRILRERWPNAQIAGLDSSEEMIRKARADHPAGEWILADAESWRPEAGYDLVFSNAALQWMRDQPRVVENLFRSLNAGGALAVQVPLNVDSPLSRALVRVAQGPRWRERMAGCDSRITYSDESFYYDLLSALTPRVEMWITIYLHVMESHQDLIDWYSSTGMRPYLARIESDGEKRAFLGEILAECRGEYPNRRDGRVIFPFKRLFFIAAKTGG